MAEPKLSATERRQLRRDLKANPLAAADGYAHKFADFQREQITILVRRIYRAVKQRKPQVTVSAAVFANDENAYTRRFQDWKRWLSMGVLTWVPHGIFDEHSSLWKQIEIAATNAHSAGRRVWAGIGAYRFLQTRRLKRSALLVGWARMA